MSKLLNEAFRSLLHSNPSEFKTKINSELKIRLAEKINSLESDVVSTRFQYLKEKSEGENRFNSLHTIEKHNHPVAPEDTFTSNMSKARYFCRH